MSVEEYLRFEAESPTKHEYVDGEVYEMSGVTRRHAQIVMNISYRLHGMARGGPCQVIAVDVKVRPRRTRFYYPDVMVVRTPGDPDDIVVTDACFIVEVTSPSTARTDRGEKREAYLDMPALRGYVIVDHRWRRVEWYARSASGEWADRQVIGTGSVIVPCPETELTLDEIYEGLLLPSVREPAADYAVDGHGTEHAPEDAAVEADVV